MVVSTHSHPKVAAYWNIKIRHQFLVSTHSHPKVAASASGAAVVRLLGFNTQPPEGGCIRHVSFYLHRRRFNTQPPEGGCKPEIQLVDHLNLFQHTATRRWLQSKIALQSSIRTVSTHSHPKVAASERAVFYWSKKMFQHTATRRWLRS